MANTPQFSDLTTIPTQLQVFNTEVLPALQNPASGIPVRVTDWFVGGVYRTMAMAVSLLRVNARTAIAAFTAAGFEDYVFGRAPAPNNIDVTGWSVLTALQRYNWKQIPATFTLRNITLTNTSATPYNSIQPGAMIIQFPSGNRYVLNAVATVPAQVGITPGQVTVQFRSEFTTNTPAGLVYNDPSNSTINLVTTNFPGVTATNPSTTYSPVSQSGGGVGLVTPGGSPIGQHAVSVQILTTGNISSGQVAWQYSIDGAAWVQQTVASVSNIAGSGINITLTDNGGIPGFIAGTFYYFTTPGSDVTQIGQDAQTAQSLGQVASGMWPALAFQKDANGNAVPASPTGNAYVLLALAFSNSVVSAFAVTDQQVNNLVRLVIAGPGGQPVLGSTITAEQTSFNALQMLTDQVIVSTSTPRPILLAMTSGAINVKQNQRAQAQSALQTSLQTYFGGVDPNLQLSINGIVDYDYLIELIRSTPGVKTSKNALASSLTVNGVAGNLQLGGVTGTYEAAQWQQSVVDPASVLPWSSV